MIPPELLTPDGQEALDSALRYALSWDRAFAEGRGGVSCGGGPWSPDLFEAGIASVHKPDAIVLLIAWQLELAGITVSAATTVTTDGFAHWPHITIDGWSISWNMIGARRVLRDLRAKPKADRETVERILRGR